MNFTYICEKCGGTELEEVVTGFYQTSQVTGLSEDGCLEYGETSYDGGNGNRYQCTNCGEIIRDNDCIAITNQQDMEEFLKGKENRK